MLEEFQVLLQKIFSNGVIISPTSVPAATEELSHETNNCNVWCFSEGSSDAVSESTKSSSEDCGANKRNQSGSTGEFVSMNKSFLSTIAEESHSYWVDDYGDLSVCTSSRRGFRNAGLYNIALPPTSSTTAPQHVEGQFGTNCGSASFETTSSRASEEFRDVAVTSDQGLLPSAGCITPVTTQFKTPQHMVVEFPGGVEPSFTSEEKEELRQHHPAIVTLSASQTQISMECHEEHKHKLDPEQWLRDDNDTTPDVLVTTNTCHQEDVNSSAVLVESKSDRNATLGAVTTNARHQEDVCSSALFVESKSANSDENTNSFWPANYLSVVVAPSFEDGRLSPDNSNNAEDASSGGAPTNTGNTSKQESSPISFSNKILQKNAVYRHSLKSACAMIGEHSSESSPRDIFQRSAQAKNSEEPSHDGDRNFISQQGMPRNIDCLNTVSSNTAAKLPRTDAEFHVEVICKLVSELRLLQNDESNKPATISAPLLVNVGSHGGADHTSRPERRMLQSAIRTNTASMTTNNTLPQIYTESRRGTHFKSGTFDAEFDDTLSTFRTSNYLSASARSFDDKVEKHSIFQHRQPFDGDVIRNEGEQFLPGVNFSSVNKHNKLLQDQESSEHTLYGCHEQYMQKNFAYRRSLNNTCTMMSKNLMSPNNAIDQLPAQPKIIELSSNEAGPNYDSEPELPRNVDYLSKALAKDNTTPPLMNAEFSVGDESNLDSALTLLQNVECINAAVTNSARPPVIVEYDGGDAHNSRPEQGLQQNAGSSSTASVTTTTAVPYMNAEWRAGIEYKSDTIGASSSPKNDQVSSNFWPINYLSAPALSFDDRVEEDIGLEHRQPIDGAFTRDEGKELLCFSQFPLGNKNYHTQSQRESPEMTPSDYSDRIMQRNAIYRRSLKHTSSIVGSKSDALHHGCSQME